MNIHNLRIAYFSDLEFPSNSVATIQIVKTVDTLRQQGMDIDLFLPIPWTNLKSHSAKRLRNIRQYYGISDQLTIREYLPVAPMTKRMHRPLSSYLMLRRIKKEKYDLIYVRNFLHLKLALEKNQNVLFETYKFLVAPRTCRMTVNYLNENENFTGMIVHSEMARQYWLSQGARSDKIITIHNGFDESDIPPPIDKQKARKALNIPSESKIICYTGNIGKAKGIEAILALAHYLPEFHFYLVGAKNKSDIQRLKELARKENVQNYTLIPWLSHTKVYQYLFSADVLMIPPTKKPLMEGGKTVLPIKTFMYLASGVPILAPDLEDTSEILKHQINAFLLKPDSPEENATEIRNLFSDAELLKEIGRRALKSSKSFSWDNRGKKIIKFLDSKLNPA